MPKKLYAAEQIILHLREAEVELAKVNSEVTITYFAIVFGLDCDETSVSRAIRQPG